MFGSIKKTIKRTDVPRGGLYYFDNYEKLCQKFEPSLVTEAIYDKKVRALLKSWMEKFKL